MIDLRTILFAPDGTDSDILFNVSSSRSPFTGGTQTVELPGARWTVVFKYENLSAEWGRQLKAIKGLLRGGAEVAHIYDLSYLPRRDIEPGVPLVNGANQSGGVLATKGWTPNTDVLKFGDQLSYLSTDGLYRMHVVTSAIVTSDASGNANIAVSPPLRNPPVDSTAIDSVKPTLSVGLSDSSSVSLNGFLHSASFTFTETLYGIL